MQRKPSRMALLQAIWLQAYKTGEVVIKFPDERSAVRTRLELYNSVKRVKSNEGLSPELSQAVNNCAISFLDPQTLSIKEKVAEDWLLEQVEAQGLDTRFLTEAPKTLAEAEAMARTRNGPSPMLLAAQAEADENERKKAQPIAPEPWTDPHAAGMPVPYGMPETAEPTATDSTEPVSIEKLKSRYGFRGER